MNLLKISKYLISMTVVFSSSAHAKLVVHEWGTFTSLVGSDGKPQGGMISEDEVLPDFVHNFGEDQAAPFFPLAWAPRPVPGPVPVDPPRNDCNRPTKIPCEFLTSQVITQKMETPVVYFYADEVQDVRFDVWFPDGIVSQSFPAATRSFPAAIPGVKLKKGFASYDVKILKNSSAQPPFVEDSNIYSHARNVASDLIQVGSEIEKFIFYRGLGAFNTEVQVTSKKGALTVRHRGSKETPAVFLISTDGRGKGDIRSLGSLSPSQELVVTAKDLRLLRKHRDGRGEFISRARRHLIKSLVGSGLFVDEAKSMIDTWEHGYFKTPGLRILYVLSRSEVERILPAKVNPVPEQFERVFVGRIEVLLDTDEEKILNQVLREEEAYDVTALGRLADPILSRVQEIAEQKGLLTPQRQVLFTVLKNKANH